MWNSGTRKIYENSSAKNKDTEGVLDQGSALPYPKARRCDHKDIFHEKYEVKDPYRWLEDNESQETVDWINGQNMVTSAYFEGLKKTNEQLYARLMELINYDKFSCIYLTASGKYLYSKKVGLQNQYVTYLKDA